MNWKFWQRRIKVIERDATRLTLSEWQSDQALTSMAAHALFKGEVRLMLDVLRNEHPGQRVYADDCDERVRLVAQARAEGYTMALANFEALGIFRKPEEALEATYESEEIQLPNK